MHLFAYNFFAQAHSLLAYENGQSKSKRSLPCSSETNYRSVLFHKALFWNLAEFIWYLTKKYFLIKQFKKEIVNLP